MSAALAEIFTRLEVLPKLESKIEDNTRTIGELKENQIDNAAFILRVKEHWDNEKKFRDRCWTAAVVIFSPLIALCWAGIKDTATWFFHLFTGKVKT